MSVSNSTDEYTEVNHDLVLKCQKFLTYHNDHSVNRVSNPFSDRTIKKNGPTYFTVYNQVRRYLQSLDDEEFHSPIKELEIIKYEVPPLLEQSPERNLFQEQTKDVIVEDWPKKIEKRLERLKTEKHIDTSIEQRYLNYLYNEPIMTVFPNQETFERKKNEWIERNIELYSFLDHYKPEIFENTYLCKQLIVYNYSSLNEFINWLPKSCETFLLKRYDQPYHTNPQLNQYQRYPSSLICLWIYQPLILEARKYLKKNSNKIKDYIASKPTHEVKIKKQHICSLIIAFLISKTPIPSLDDAKNNWEDYFKTKLTEFFTLCDRERMFNRAYYTTLITDFLGNRIRPYKYTHIKFEDLEHFDLIIKNMNCPPPLNEIDKSEDDD
jgi:hypothetical protein